MKIIFFDRHLDNHEVIEFTKEWSKVNNFCFDGECTGSIIDAAYGISCVLQEFEQAQDYDDDNNWVILTNSTDLLTRTNWRDIYLLTLNYVEHTCKVTIKPIQEYSDRKLQDELDIQQLYINGAFGKVYTPEFHLDNN